MMNKSWWAAGFHLDGNHYGGNDPVYVIAEIGTNHTASLERAKKLVSACAEAGADAVKFQSWTVAGLQNMIEVNGEQATAAVISVLEKYQLPEDWHAELMTHCRAKGVDFLSTPFDLGRARLLRDLGVGALKIASGDLTYDELLEEVGGYGLPLLLSTGMANLGEIEHALTCLDDVGRPGDRVLLHCVAAYPPDPGDANLLAIRTLRETFGLPVGISDHFPGREMVLAAVALGAVVVEKHVTFSRQDGAPDSPFALEVPEFRDMVVAVRALEQSLGDGRKRCMPSEMGGLLGGRRSLFAARDLVPGECLTRDAVAVVRPNVAELKPQHLNEVLGCRLAQIVPRGTPLRWHHFKAG